MTLKQLKGKELKEACKKCEHKHGWQCEFWDALISQIAKDLGCNKYG